MKQIEKIASGKNFNAADVGILNELGDYTLKLGADIEIPGKIFGGNALHTTGCEFSLQLFRPVSETGFLHTHKNHEELYLFLKGKGEFQVDGDIFPVKEGSVVRVSPAGKRSVRNNGTEPLAMLCLQYKSDTFNAEDASDGIISNEPVKWR
ncbi:MAG: cupin domain-containing protein [Rikenellaceae bacterium]|nr:cupin domain-containing protein [Rikenellaceae bacterium]